MRAKIIPYNPRKSLALGGERGIEINGPILYVPGKGFLVYETSLTGDVDGMDFVTMGVKYFEERSPFLTQLERQLRGEKDLGGIWKGERFDLSNQQAEVDIPDEELKKIISAARRSYRNLDRFKRDSMKLILDIETRMGREKIGYGA